MTDAGDSAKLVSDADIDALAIRFEDCWRSCDTRTAIREVMLPWIEQHATPADGAEALRLAWKAGYDHCDKHATPSSATSEAHNYHDNLPSNKMTLPHAVLAYEDAATEPDNSMVWTNPAPDASAPSTPSRYGTFQAKFVPPHPIERQAGELIGITPEMVEACRKSFDAYVSGHGYVACRLAEDWLKRAAAPAQAAQGNTKDKNKI